MSHTAPLKGLKVVDFTRVLAGPHCTRILSDLGAEVIKIEPPRGDLSRLALPGDEAASLSYYFIQQNGGKRNISIDLNFPEGREIALRMCDTADIIVENFRAGTLRFFGLDYEKVTARNPKVIYASISGYGQGSPLSHRGAYAPAVHAESGFLNGMLSHMAEDLANPRHDAYSHADVYTGLEAVIGILAAIRHRDQTGEGQHIDIAMAATMLAVNERVHADLSGIDLGAEPPAMGPADSPFFRTSYGEFITIAVSIVGSLIFPSYLAAMHRPDLAKDPRFLTAELRQQNVKDLHEIIQQWILTFPTAGALEAQLDEAKLAFGVVRSVKDFAESEWAEWWGAIEEVTDRRGNPVRIPGKPWKFSKSSLLPAREAAYRGEHNAEVMKEFGYSQQQIDQLVQTGVLVSNIPEALASDAPKPSVANS